VRISSCSSIQPAECLADPGAHIELFVDPAGEAAVYLGSLQTDDKGRFTIPRDTIPAGYVLTATATVEDSTSEFNVIAGPPNGPILHALLAQTGPLADRCDDIRMQARLRRWPPGTRLIFHLREPPRPEIEHYARFICAQIAPWTLGQITAEVRVGRWIAAPPGTVVIPIRWIPATEPRLAGRGGLTFLKWNRNGTFVPGIEILLAEPAHHHPDCPPILAHEVGHALGLHHVRVGLLSRMQGSVPPNGTQWVNDFSAVPTFYDVLALHILYDRAGRSATTLGELVTRGLVPDAASVIWAQAEASPPASTLKP